MGTSYNNWINSNRKPANNGGGNFINIWFLPPFSNVDSKTCLTGHPWNILLSDLFRMVLEETFYKTAFSEGIPQQNFLSG